MRNLKRALSLALSTVMLLGMMVVGTSAKSYPDVDATMNVEAIEVMQLIGAMKGDDGKFNPNKVISRNEMAAVVSKMLGFQDGIEATALPYKDFPYNEQWAKPFVAAIYAKGITAGISANAFGGSHELTTAQAAMWMLKALGYFQNPEDIPTGTSWELAAITKADEIGLLKYVKAAANQGITRNEVAQMVLNALQADVVKAVGTKGTNITTTDGTVVNVGYNITYEAVETYNGEYANSGFEEHSVLGNDKRLQLAEKLYDGDLTLDKYGLDSMNRPANVWKYKTENVKATKRPEKVYTSEVKVKDIYNDLGRPDNYNFVSRPFSAAERDNPNYYNYHDLMLVDGQFNQMANDGQKLNRNSKDQKVGGNGVVTEVFVDRSAREIVISSTHIYADKIVKVDENGTADRNVKVKHETETYDTEDFKKDDIVLYTVNKEGGKNEIKSMMLPVEKKTGTIEKIVVTDKTVYIDGVKYQVSDSARIEDAGNNDLCNLKVVEPKDKVDFYLDANGFIAKMDIAEDNINLADYAYIQGFGEDKSFKGKTQAELVFADGTKKIVNLSNDLSSDKLNLLSDDKGDGTIATRGNVTAETVTSSQIVRASYDEKKGEYTLDKLTASDNKSVEMLKSLTDFDNKTPRMNKNVALDSKTVFVYRMDHNNGSGNADWKYTTYTGFASAPSLNSPNSNTMQFTAVLNNDNIAEFVYVTGQKNDFNTSTAEKNWIYVAYDKDVKQTTAGDNVKYYEYTAIIDGKVTTAKVKDPISPLGLLGDGYELNSDGIIKNSSDVTYSGTTHPTAFQSAASMDVDGKTMLMEVKHSNGVITIKGAATGSVNGTYGYEKDVQVYIVDRDGKNIDKGTVDDLTSSTDIYQSVSYTVNNDGRIDAIVVVYK